MTANMLTRIDAPLLAAAFPTTQQDHALAAGERVVQLLYASQWTDRFAVHVGREELLIPYRLHFAAEGAEARRDECWRYVRALQTRSNDGFQRQRAVQDLVQGTRPWEAPFVVALLGEYVVEILGDVADALDPALEQRLAQFIVDNPAFWATTKRRVTSYWNVYYRRRRTSETRRAYTRSDYVGFHIVERLEAAARTIER